MYIVITYSGIPTSFVFLLIWHSMALPCFRGQFGRSSAALRHARGMRPALLVAGPLAPRAALCAAPWIKISGMPGVPSGNLHTL